MNDFDVVIRNASIIDGTGAPPFEGSVGLRGDRIARVGDINLDANEKGALEIDARGHCVAPGFIDVHSHDDWAVLLMPEMDFKVMQGVTTDIVGNCGMGAAPNPAASVIFRSLHGDAKIPEWSDYRGYLRAIDENPPSINVAVLAGHGSIRLAAMGNAKRAPDAAEMAKMREWLRDAVDAGVVGLSTGLIYEPGRYALTDELIELATEMRGSGALYASHMRNEGNRLLDSIRETIRIGEEAGAAIQISHHKASGRENWGMVRESLKLIDYSRAREIDVTADQYPYTSGSTVLSAVIMNGGLDENPAPSGGMGRVLPEEILIASVPSHPEWEGKRLDQLSAEMDLGAAEAARRIVREEPGTVVIMNSMDEDDVRTVMRHPSTMIGSDGLPMGGKPHPRLYGTFPRVLGHYSRDGGLMSLEEAVHRMTGMPAAKFHLRDRGVIREGAFADLLIFDRDAIADTATYSDPRRYPAGISHVFVNGTAVVRDAMHLGARPGRALRRD
jgi:N-acyl-D-amino-acid deacylase